MYWQTSYSGLQIAAASADNTESSSSVPGCGVSDATLNRVINLDACNELTHSQSSGMTHAGESRGHAR